MYLKSSQSETLNKIIPFIFTGKEISMKTLYIYIFFANFPFRYFKLSKRSVIILLVAVDY